jgi:hypothetical protein
MMIRLAIITPLLAISVLLPVVGLCESYAHSYIRMCPNGAQIARLQHQFDRADALLDDGRFTLAKKLASALYDCSTSLSDPYERDIAKYFSISYVAYSSFKRDSERIASQFNELAANTRFRDIRRMAIKARDQLRAE